MTVLLPNGKPHVSFSEMGNWMHCSWRHGLKYVKKIDIEKRGTATIIGTMFHEAIEIKLTDASPLRSYIVALGLEELEKVTIQEEKDEFDVEKATDRVFELVDEAIPFLNLKFPQWKLIGVEETLYEVADLQEVKHPDAKFKGFVDLIIEVPGKRESVFWVIDWKTAVRPWGREKLTDPKITYQLSLYKNFWAAKHGVALNRVRTGYAIALKKAKPGKAFNFIPISVGPTTSKRTLTVLNNFIGSMKRGMAIKNKSEFNCRYCEYKNTEWCP